MSLRGLIWTAPQGYILQLLGFGWEYSLSGSLMGLFYFMGALTPAIDNSSFSKTYLKIILRTLKCTGDGGSGL